MKIYWTLKILPNLKNYRFGSAEEGGGAYKIGLSVLADLGGPRPLRGDRCRHGWHRIFSGLGAFIYGQIVTHIVLKHYRHRLQDVAK